MENITHNRTGGEPFEYLLEAAAQAASAKQYEQSGELLALRNKLLKLIKNGKH